MRKKTRVMRISRQPSPAQMMTDQKQLGNVEYFNSVGSLITYDAIRTRELKSRIALAKTAFNNKDIFLQQIGFKFKGGGGTSEALYLEHSFV